MSQYLSDINRKYFEYAPPFLPSFLLFNPFLPFAHLSIPIPNFTRILKHSSTIASTYDDKPWVKVGLKQLSGELLAKREWMGVKWTNEEETGDREVKMLDFACGPGIASAVRILFTFVRTVLL